MASTYTLNNGIELIGTGEQSGTWGDTTNTNLELIDTALDGQVSLTLSSAGSSGSPNALPVSDGASSNGRNRLISYVDGGDLGATAYVQLTPNDAEKIIYIRNALSGSRSIIVFQGTYNASNDYEIPAGTTAVVYFNGGGTGAVAANVFNNAYFDGLRLGSVSVTAILDEDNMASNSATALSTQQSIKAYVDSQVGTVDTLAEVLANGNTTGGTDIAVSTGDDITFADSSKAIFGAGSDLQIYHDGNDSKIIENGNGDLYIGGASNMRFVNSAVNATYAMFTEGGKVQLNYNDSKRFETTATGIDVTGITTTDGLTSDSTVTVRGGNKLILNRADNATRGEINYVSGTGFVLNDANGDGFNYNVGATNKLRIDSSGNVGIGRTPVNTLSPSLEMVSGGSFFGYGDALYLASNLYYASGWKAMATGGGAKYVSDSNGHRFYTSASASADAAATPVERMRIDTSGNLLVGKTSANATDVGIVANANGRLYATASGDSSIFNRTSSDGDIVEFRKDGTSVGSIGVNGSYPYIGSHGTSGKGLKITDALLPATNAGAFNDADVNLGASNVRFKDGYFSGSIANPSGDLTLDVAGDIILDAGGQQIVLKDDGTTFAEIYQASNNLYIESKGSDKDIFFRGNDGGSDITALTLDMSEAGAATFNGGVRIPGFITHVGDDNTFFGFPAGDQFRLETAGLERMSVNGGGTTFNEDGEDLDFRVESNGQSSMLFVDGGNNRVGVGTSSPNTDLEVRVGVTSAIRVSGGSNTNYKTEIGYDNSTGPYIKAGSSGIQTLQFYVDNTSLALTLASNRNATFAQSVTATTYYGDGSNLTGVGGSTDFNAVGTYTWLAVDPAQSVNMINEGDTISGSYLKAAGNGQMSAHHILWSSTVSAGVSGTWRLMGGQHKRENGSYATANLFVRIS